MKSRIVLVLLLCAALIGCSTLKVEREYTTDQLTKTTGLSVQV